MDRIKGPSRAHQGPFVGGGAEFRIWGFGVPPTLILSTVAETHQIRLVLIRKEDNIFFNLWTNIVLKSKWFK